MIHKVEIVNHVDVTMTVTHNFEAVVDSPQEAYNFGAEVMMYTHMFAEGMNDQGGGLTPNDG